MIQATKVIKICSITTRAMTMTSFMIDTLNYFSQNGFEVTIICEPSSVVKSLINEKIKYYPIPMKAGNVSIFEITKIVRELKRIFRNEKYDIVQYASTNAGLYASIAAKKCKIPIRIFLQWGMMYVGSTGLKRLLYKSIEKMICHNSTVVQSDSRSNADFAISEKVVEREKCEIIWNGSSTGVNIDSFNCDYKNDSRALKLKRDLKIDEDGFVFGFVGRVNKEKGINELLEAMVFLLHSCKRKIYLLIVGPLEKDIDLNEKVLRYCEKYKQILYVGMQEKTQLYYSIMDVFILPSYREGIATVLLEACASGLPILSTNINGSIDVVSDGYNGFLFEVKSIDSLLNAMKKILNLSAGEYQLYCKNSRKTATEKFSHEILKKMLLDDRKNKYEKYKEK